MAKRTLTVEVRPVGFAKLAKQTESLDKSLQTAAKSVKGFNTAFDGFSRRSVTFGNKISSLVAELSSLRQQIRDVNSATTSLFSRGGTSALNDFSAAVQKASADLSVLEAKTKRVSQNLGRATSSSSSRNFSDIGNQAKEILKAKEAIQEVREASSEASSEVESGLVKSFDRIGMSAQKIIKAKENIERMRKSAREAQADTSKIPPTFDKIGREASKIIKAKEGFDKIKVAAKEAAEASSSAGDAQVAASQKAQAALTKSAAEMRAARLKELQQVKDQVRQEQEATQKAVEATRAATKARTEELAAIRSAAREKQRLSQQSIESAKREAEAVKQLAETQKRARNAELAAIRAANREKAQLAKAAAAPAQRLSGSELSKQRQEALRAQMATKAVAQEMTNVGKNSENFKKAADNAKRFNNEINRGRKGLFDFVNIAKVAAGNLIAIFTTEIVFGFRRFVGNVIEATSTLQDLANKVRLVAKENENLALTQASLFTLAKDTRSSLEGTIELYTRLARSTEQLGLSQSRLLRITETVNKATIISGATAREAEQGLIQLGQAIASNRLGGDEFRSVSEQLPEISRIIADSLGVTRGELRKLAEEGVLTADVLVTAFEGAANEVDEKFGKIDLTIGQALTNLRTSALERLSQDVEKISNAVVGGVQLIEKNINNLIRAFEALVTIVTVLAVRFAALKIAQLITQFNAASKALIATNAFFSAGSTAVNGYTLALAGARRATSGFLAVLAANPITAFVLAIYAAVTAVDILDKKFNQIEFDPENIPEQQLANINEQAKIFTEIKLDALVKSLGEEYKESAGAAALFATQQRALIKQEEAFRSQVAERINLLSQARKEELARQTQAESLITGNRFAQLFPDFTVSVRFLLDREAFREFEREVSAQALVDQINQEFNAMIEEWDDELARIQIALNKVFENRDILSDVGFDVEGFDLDDLENATEEILDLTKDVSAFNKLITAENEFQRDVIEEIVDLQEDNEDLTDGIAKNIATVRVGLEEVLDIASEFNDINTEGFFDFKFNLKEKEDELRRELETLEAELSGGELAVLELEARYEAEDEVNEFVSDVDRVQKRINDLKENLGDSFFAPAIAGTLDLFSQGLDKLKNQAEVYAAIMAGIFKTLNLNIKETQDQIDLAGERRDFESDRAAVREQIRLVELYEIEADIAAEVLEIKRLYPDLTEAQAVEQAKLNDAQDKYLEKLDKQKKRQAELAADREKEVAEFTRSLNEIQRDIDRGFAERRAILEGGEAGQLAFQIQSDVDDVLYDFIEAMEEIGGPESQKAIDSARELADVRKREAEQTAQLIVAEERRLDAALRFESTFDRAFSNFFDDILRNPKDAFKNLLDTIEDGFIDLAADILDEFFNPLKEALKGLARDIGGAIFGEGGLLGGGGFGGFFKQFEEGVLSSNERFSNIFSGLGFGDGASSALGSLSTAATGGFAGFEIGKGVNSLIGNKGNKSSIAAGGALGGLAGLGGGLALGGGLGAVTGVLTGGSLAAAGAALGSVVPIVGTIVGALLGTVLGGLLSKPSDNIAQAVFNPSSGRVLGTGNETDKNVDARNDLVDFIQQFTTTITDNFGGQLTDNPNTPYREDLINLAVGSRDGIRVGFQGPNGLIAQQSTFSTSDEGAALAAAKAAELTLSSIEGGNRSIIDFGISVLQITGDLEASADSIDALAGALDFLNEPLSETEKRLETVRDEFRTLINQANGQGLDTTDLYRQMNDALRALRDNFIEEIDDTILAIESPFAAGLKELIQGQEQRIEDALAFPAHMVDATLEAAQRLNEVELDDFVDQNAAGINQIIEQLNPFATNETLESINEFTASFDVLTEAASSASGEIANNIERIIGELEGTLQEAANAFDRSIAEEILSFENPQAVQLRNLLNEQQQSIEIAEALGASVDQVLTLTARKIEDLISAAASSPESLVNLAEGFSMLISEMEATGQSVQPLIEAFQRAQAEVVNSFNENVTDRILEITQPNLQAFKSLLTAQEAELSIAQQIGADTLILLQAQALERQQFLDGLSDDELTDLGDFIGLIEDFTGKISVVTGELNTIFDRQIEGFEKLSDEAENLASSFDSTAEAIRETINSIKDRYGLGTPGERLSNLRTSFQSTFESALLGDKASLDRLPELGNQLIEQSRELFGGTTAFQGDLDFVLGILQQAEEVAKTRAQEERDRLEAILEQRDLLKEIRDILRTEGTTVSDIQTLADQVDPQNAEVVNKLAELISLIEQDEADIQAVKDFLQTQGGAESAINDLYAAAGIMNPDEAASGSNTSATNVITPTSNQPTENAEIGETFELLLAVNEQLVEEVRELSRVTRSGNDTNENSERELKRIRDAVVKSTEENETITNNLLRDIRDKL